MHMQYGVLHLKFSGAVWRTGNKADAQSNKPAQSERAENCDKLYIQLYGIHSDKNGAVCTLNSFSI